MKDINSLEHTKWRCQYHIVFSPKYRRQVMSYLVVGLVFQSMPYTTLTITVLILA